VCNGTTLGAVAELEAGVGKKFTVDRDASVAGKLIA